MKKRRNSEFLIILLLVICLLTSCGKPATDQMDRKKETGESQNVTSDQSGGIDNTHQLKVAMLGKDFKVVTIILADALNYYEEEGVNVQFEKSSNLNDALTAVDMGKIDVLPFGVIPTVAFVSQGSDVVVIGGTIAEGSEIVVQADNQGMIKTAEDFRGKKIACYRNETGHMVMRDYLRQHGLDPDKDMEFMLLDGQQSEIEAVRKGEADLCFLNSGQGYTAMKSDLIVDQVVGHFVPDFPCCRQTTSRKTLNEKRDALIKFEMANLRACSIYLNDHDKAVELIATYSEQPKEMVRAILYGSTDPAYHPAMIVSLDPNSKKVNEFYETMKSNGDIDPSTSYSMADHIDSTIYKEALNRLIDRGGSDKELYENLLNEFYENN